MTHQDERDISYYRLQLTKAESTMVFMRMKLMYLDNETKISAKTCNDKFLCDLLKARLIEYTILLRDLNNYLSELYSDEQMSNLEYTWNGEDGHFSNAQAFPGMLDLKEIKTREDI